MKFLWSLLPALMLFCFTGCVKKEKLNQPIGDRSQLLRNTVWRVVALKDNGREVVLDCRGDDKWAFNEGGTGQKQDGKDRCGSDAEGFTDFRWFVSGDQRTLEIYQYAGVDYGVQLDTKWMDWEVAYLTNDRFDVRYYATIDGVGHYYELSFKK